MLTWHYITSEVYKAAGPEQKTADKLFYLSDTRQIYRGTDLFTEACRLYDTTEPTAPAVGVLYIEQNTLEGKIYNGSTWQTVIQPIQSTVDSGNTNKPVSGKAVADYVTSAISGTTGEAHQAFKNASYDAGTHTLTFTRNSDSDPVTVDITDMPVDLVYDGGTGLLQLKDETGSPIGTGVNLDLERFVSAAAYDATTKEILLAFTGVSKIDTGASYTYPGTMPAEPSKGLACRAGGTWYVYNTDSWAPIAKDETPLAINVGDLVDTYTAGNTETVQMSVSGNQFTADVVVSPNEGNQLTKDGSGLFVAAPDMSGKMDKDADAVNGNLAKFDNTGNAIDAGVKAGGATLTNNDTATLATEAAVEAIRSALQTAIDGKVSKMSGDTADNLVAATGNGQVKDSGFKAGGNALTGGAKTLATEKAVQDAITALNIGNKMDKDTDAVAGNFAKFEAGGNAVDAGVVMGGAALASEPTATTIASEAAVAAALTWKTSI